MAQPGGPLCVSGQSQFWQSPMIGVSRKQRGQILVSGTSGGGSTVGRLGILAFAVAFDCARAATNLLVSTGWAFAGTSGAYLRYESSRPCAAAFSRFTSLR